MKNLKLPKSNIIAMCIITAILFLLGIIFLVLPDDVYYAIGDSYPEVGRYVLFVGGTFFAIIALIRTLVFVSKQKKFIAEYNAMREQCGEDAFFVAGYCEAINKDNSNAINTVVSVLGAAASAVLFGVGAYRVFATDTIRLFLLCDDGMYVIRTKTKEKIFLKKDSITTATLEETPKGQLRFICPNENFVLTFDTLKIDVTNDELTQKLKLLFFDEDDTTEKAQEKADNVLK